MKEQLCLKEKVIWVQGLLIGCPLGEALENCPAKDLRSLAISDRLKLVSGMDEGTLDQIIAHHKGCLAAREN